MNTRHPLTLTALTLATLTLAACSGSSSSGGDSTPSTNLSVTTLQGLWRSPAGAASTLSAVVLPDGKVWALMSNASGTSVIKATFAAQNSGFAASGKRFVLGTTTSGSVSLTASVVEKSSLSGSISSGTQSEPYGLAYQSRYETAATLADFAGNWQATLGPGTVNWTISATGALTGTRSTGCTYTGQLSSRAEQKAVVDAAITETCAEAVTALAGVAVKTEDKDGITVLLSNTDESAAVAVTLAKSS